MGNKPTLLNHYEYLCSFLPWARSPGVTPPVWSTSLHCDCCDIYPPLLLLPFSLSLSLTPFAKFGQAQASPIIKRERIPSYNYLQTHFSLKMNFLSELSILSILILYLSISSFHS